VTGADEPHQLSDSLMSCRFDGSVEGGKGWRQMAGEMNRVETDGGDRRSSIDDPADSGDRHASAFGYIGDSIGTIRL